MSFSVWMLLAFTMWTVSLLLFTVGIYRWSRILTGRVQIKDFPADAVQGEDWYLRAMRAHANCVENLPIFTVLVMSVYVSEISSRSIDIMAGVVLIARIAQSVIHVAFTQTNAIAFTRFVFFLLQLLCFILMAAIVVRHAW